MERRCISLRKRLKNNVGAYHTVHIGNGSGIRLAVPLLEHERAGTREMGVYGIYAYCLADRRPSHGGSSISYAL